MFAFLEEILHASPEWTEIRHHKRVQTSVTAEKGELRIAEVDTFAGVGIRVLVAGAWGFSSTNSLEKGALTKALEEAISIARFMSGAKEEKVTLAEVEPARGAIMTHTDDPVTAHTIEEKIGLVRAFEEKMRTSSPAVSSATAGYVEYLDEKHYLNSDGARCHITEQRPELRMSAVAAKDGEMSLGHKSTGVTGGWSDLFTKGTPEELSAKAAGLAVDGLSAPYADGGVHAVVLAPEMVGLLSHEAIGHTVEADFVLSGSVVQGKIGERVASELVTLVDTGHADYAPLAAGCLPVDDEGVAGRKTVVIENGVLKSYLHNRETATRFDVEPTGNARAWEFNNEPLIRMRNTCIAPGETSLDEMIAGIKDGYYLCGAGGGQADANAEFMFQCSEAYRIRDGKKGELVREVTTSGQAFDVLKSVDAVGSDFDWAMGSGFCGKMQPAKVDGGGPSMRCELTIGGKQKG